MKQQRQLRGFPGQLPRACRRLPRRRGQEGNCKHDQCRGKTQPRPLDGNARLDAVEAVASLAHNGGYGACEPVHVGVDGSHVCGAVVVEVLYPDDSDGFLWLGDGITSIL